MLETWYTNAVCVRVCVRWKHTHTHTTVCVYLKWPKVCVVIWVCVCIHPCIVLHVVYLRTFDVFRNSDDCCNMWGRLRASGARPLRQFAHHVCSLAGPPHCKIRLQTFRGAGGGTAPAPGRVGASARAWIGPGSAAYRWLALGGQLGQRARRLDGRGPATASRSSGVTRPGAEVQGEPTAASSAAWLAWALSLWRQTEGWRAALQGIGRKWRTQAARKPLAENSNWPIYDTLSDTGGTDPAIQSANLASRGRKGFAFHTGTNGLY